LGEVTPELFYKHSGLTFVTIILFHLNSTWIAFVEKALRTLVLESKCS